MRFIPLFALASCAPVDTRPPIVQVSTRTVEVKVPTPVPCFTEAERPVMKPPTPVDLVNGTADQWAKAIDADALNDKEYAEAVDRLFIQCQKAGQP
jgi:hypothetical protein